MSTYPDYSTESFSNDVEAKRFQDLDHHEHSRRNRYLIMGTRVFVTTDPDEERRLRRKGWQKSTRREAQDYLGGPTWFARVLAKCGTGEMLLHGKRWCSQSDLDIECSPTSR